MQLNEARNVIEDRGVEEGSRFGWYDMDGENKKGEIEITSLEGTSAGVREVEHVIEANGGEHERSESVKDVAEWLEQGIWGEE